ncbi:AAA family ATPase [Anaerosporobacter sp.]|uniref:AAA family ATPase n=1 Tax=Anaerosporobacter sp. TaxID=1872529 RepID=UPI00286EE2A2|nr:ATP-binding protein [Anaerosporobacter sp.]
MLIKLIVDNFKSFNKETELTMIPSNKTRKKVDHKISVKSTPLLKYAVIYGANAAGKSNLVEAFNFIQYSVVKAIPAYATTMFCKSEENNSKRASTFELQFTVNGKFYAYGFSLILKERKITAEWLYQLYQNGTAKTLFERELGKKPQLGEDVLLEKVDEIKLQTYLEDFDEKSNMLFLSFMNKEKKYNPNSKMFFFKEVFNWINENMEICTPQTSLTSFEYYYDDASLTIINELIKTFDTGISKVSINEISRDEFKKELPESIFDNLMEELKKKLEESDNKKFKVSMRSHNSFFNIENTKNGELKVSTIKLTHGNSFYDFKFKEESDGTRRLFELLDILLNKSENKVYVIDEMERSLHPKLTSKFIELFDRLHPDQKIQLIFTTHESTIMDQELFRRDEIWFVERDKDNNSNIYSLDKFKERYDKKLSKAYLEGRYGAVPVFTSFNFKEV